MTADIAGLDRVLAHVQAHPEEWDQTEWIVRKPGCGTAGCIAYTTAMLNGWVPTEWDNDGTIYVQKNAVVKAVYEVACTLLRVYGYEADRLFSSANSFDTLMSIRDELADDVESSER